MTDTYTVGNITVELKERKATYEECLAAYFWLLTVCGLPLEFELEPNMDVIRKELEDETEEYESLR